MGFLDNIALRKTERSLRPFMRSDERIIDYDIADVEQVGRNVPVVLTNRAIYFVGTTAIRVPYSHILDLQARGSVIVAIATKSGNAFLIQVVGPPKGDLYQTISHHLDKVIKHQQLVDVPGGQVFAVCRQLDEDADLTWVLQHSEQVSLEDLEVREAVADELRSVADRIGVPLPWH